MRIVLQRVSRCAISIDGILHSSIGAGIMLLLGIEDNDDLSDIDWLTGKISRLRIFDDENHVMNKAITEIGGQVMVVSQFTLHALVAKGNRPSYIRAARPEKAVPLYEEFVRAISLCCATTAATGIFGADMQVELVNDGPVTIIIDSKNRE